MDWAEEVAKSKRKLKGFTRKTNPQRQNPKGEQKDTNEIVRNFRGLWGNGKEGKRERKSARKSKKTQGMSRNEPSCPKKREETLKRGTWHFFKHLKELFDLKKAKCSFENPTPWTPTKCRVSFDLATQFLKMDSNDPLLFFANSEISICLKTSLFIFRFSIPETCQLTQRTCRELGLVHTDPMFPIRWKNSLSSPLDFGHLRKFVNFYFRKTLKT